MRAILLADVVAGAAVAGSMDAASDSAAPLAKLRRVSGLKLSEGVSNGCQLRQYRRRESGVLFHQQARFICRHHLRRPGCQFAGVCP